MTAKAEGKINAATVAAEVQAGRTVRVLVTDHEWGKHATPEFLAGGTPERLVPSNVKTKVVAATVHSASALMTSGGRRSSRQYTLHTDKGDLTGLAPIQTMWLAPDDTPEPAPAADTAPVPAEPVPTPTDDVTAVEVDGTIVAFTSRVDLTEPEPEPEPVIARRATTREAKRHFEAGGTVLVSERGGKSTTVVHRLTTTHDRTRITWEELAATVDEWKNRYPNQRYYIVPGEPVAEPEALSDEDTHRVSMFAGKFLADTTSMEPPVFIDPTDDKLSRAFSRASKPPKRELYPAIRAEVARRLAENPPPPALFGYEVSGLLEGDVVQLPGEWCTRVVESVHYDGEARTHTARFTVLKGTVDRMTWPSTERHEVTLIDRPGCGPLDATYQVGDRVTVLGYGAVREPIVGVVKTVQELPIDGWMTAVYEVQTVKNTVAAAADSMAPAPTPEPGQRWISFGRFGPSVATVVGPSADPLFPHGLVTECEELRGVMLSAPNWRLLDESNPDDLAHARQSALKRRPAVGKILARVARMGDTDRTALIDAGLRHRSVYRKDQTNLTERAARAYGEHWRDLFAVWDQVASAVSLDGSQPKSGHVVADAVYAELVREHLNDNEYRIFAGPWLDVIGVRA